MSIRTAKNRAIFLIQMDRDEFIANCHDVNSLEDIACKSYILSTIEDILDRLKNKEDKRKAQDILEEYIALMDEYSTHNKKTSYMFSVAYDTALDIYDRVFLRPFNEGV